MNDEKNKLITFVVDLSRTKVIYTHLGKYLKMSYPLYHVWKFPNMDNDGENDCSYLKVNETKHSIEITVTVEYYNKKKLYFFDINGKLK